MRLRSLFAVSLLHGPAELLPISSSAHVGLLLRDLDPGGRKELEVAVHAGTLLALGLPRPRLWLVTATVPAAIAGALFERRIEHLGPRSTAFGLVAGGIAMAIADSMGRGQSPPSIPWVGDSPRRGFRGSGTVPGWFSAGVVGLAQAVALVPGVSRHGAALTALRALGFSRADAHALSREASKPVLAGAVALKGWRVVRRGGPLVPLAVSAAGSFLGTRAALRVVGAPPLWPFALYRAALAASVLRMDDRSADRV
ncbi:MAG: Undecaprenyl-diphosphatase [uncultured Solirubrobacteraceae bacterium]|uniref:Undecaprenyl-diphosphatase n=1 Tax=uncultured Solirubrobacteraceae bacterium TaxID=1162706 RepID=A0A6J4RZU6_9ACTN|nr:MAG: Undecaprenyl-diphosphatase [uncultured Solirubrobacteraceae bacterium]